VHVDGEDRPPPLRSVVALLAQGHDLA
jgi:hypothetical protein